jgi:hypothetical protein
MKFRIAIEVPDGPSHETAPAIHHALRRFAHGIGLLGRVPTGPTPLFGPQGGAIGRAWIEEEAAEAEAAGGR